MLIFFFPSPPFHSFLGYNQSEDLKEFKIHKPPFGPALVFLLLAILISFAYRNSLDVPWHFDDKQNIVDNPNIQVTNPGWDEIKAVLKSGATSGVLRQSTYLGFAINFYISSKFSPDGGFDPGIWHIVNIVIHILTSYLVFLLSFDILKRTRENWDEGFRYLISFGSAILFALNPIQTQVVIYIVQRLASLAAFWYILTLLLYIKHRTVERKIIPFLGNFPLLVWVLFLGFSNYYVGRMYGFYPGSTAFVYICFGSMILISIPVVYFCWKWGFIRRQDGGIYLLLALISGFIALTTKENTITLPFCCWLYDYLFISGSEKGFLRRSLAGWGIVVLFILGAGHVLWQAIMNTYVDRNFTVWERVLTQFRVVWSYVFRMIYPAPKYLNLDIDYNNFKFEFFEKPITIPVLINITSTMIAILATLSAVVGSIFGFKKDKLIPFLILWYFGQLAVESSFIGLEMAFEHRFYLPGWSLFLLISTGIFKLLETIAKEWKLVSPVVFMSAIAGVIFILISVQSIMWIDQRNNTWLSEITLWEDVVKKSPKKSRPKVNLGFLYVDDAQRIEERMSKAISDQDFAEYKKLQAQAMKRYMDAENMYREALKIDPESNYAMVNLGHLFLMQKDLNRALDTFQQAEKNDPEDPLLQFNMGVTYKELGARAQAREHYQRALDIKPDYYQVYNNLGILEIEEGNFDAAVAAFTKATEVYPFPSLAWYNLGNVYAKKAQEIFQRSGESDPGYKQNLDKAAECYESALKIVPNYLQANVNLANVLSMNHKFDEAIARYAKALEIDPDHINTHYNLGLIYMNNLNRPDDAIFHFKEVLRINPNVERAAEVEAAIRELQGLHDGTKQENNPDS
jgi:tetratricopeptide (TPR) repeat protein